MLRIARVKPSKPPALPEGNRPALPIGVGELAPYDAPLQLTSGGG
jgi:hypothetical protein